jgi:hypothetical protein
MELNLRRIPKRNKYKLKTHKFRKKDKFLDKIYMY